MTDDPPPTDQLADLLGIHRLVYQERWTRNMSQAELARRSGVPQAMISRIEAAQRVPTWASLVALLAALGLQPAVAAVPLWSDIDDVAARLRSTSLEQRCSDLESWLRDIADAREVPMAICGASAGLLYGLPVRPRRIELVTSTSPSDIAAVLRWMRSHGMHWIDPRTMLHESYYPDLDHILFHGGLTAWWGRYDAQLAVRADYDPAQVVRMHIFDFDVPVLSLSALTSMDPWTRRVLRAQQDRARQEN